MRGAKAVIAALLCVSFDKTISIRTSFIAGVTGALISRLRLGADRRVD